jgi:hypothetical protein
MNKQHPKKDYKSTTNIEFEEWIWLLEKRQLPSDILKCKTYWIDILSQTPPTGKGRKSVK